MSLGASSVVLAEILTEIGNVFSSEFSCSGIVGDWSWKCFRIFSVAFVTALHSEVDKLNNFFVAI